MRTLKSSSAHGETLRRLLDAIERSGLKLFAQFDHSAAAREVEMELPNEVVVVFGNPRAGTPLMQQDPRVGIELPMRVLVWDDHEGTKVGFNDPRRLLDLYDVAAGAALEAMFSLIDQLAQEAAASQGVPGE
jgi:uncharacterized protein (DUF302 family)